MAGQRTGYLAEIDICDRAGTAAGTLALQVAFGLACAGTFILARMLVDQVAPTAGPFALIYPAVLVATLFGRWRAGTVAYLASLLWTWHVVLPHAALLQLAHPADGPRMLVNAVTLLIVLVFAELFRHAIRRAAAERDAAIADLRGANHGLEHKVAEQTRERSRTWAISPDLLSVINPNGRFEAINPAWPATLGWSPEHILATPFVDFIHPDDIERTRAVWAHILEGNPVLRFENRYAHADGGWRWLSWVVAPESGRYYCSARDVTEKKQAEQELAAMQETLRQSQKLEAIGQLTGGVAHDLNNLLTVIKGSADLLKRPDLAEERRARYVAAISDTADRAAKLTGQLLAFARRQALKPEPFDVGRSAEEIGSIVRTLVGSRIHLVIDAPAQAVHVLADRSQFDTAIVNLVVNARDAMDGEGRLTIAAGPVSGLPAIRGHAPVTGDYVAITVRDTGAGIDPADLDRIFEPFFTTKAVGAGTGLGLSQVIGFAKQSGGDVRVDSVPGEGTTFALYLPRFYPDGDDHATAPVEASDVGGDGLCVLVVEDNAAVGEFATAALKELGYESVLADGGEQALEQLAATPDRFHVVFSDVVMPGMDGLELGERVRDDYPGVSVILTSGYSHVLARNGQHGFELLHKPYSVEQLSRVLRKAIAWQRARQQA